MVTMGREFVARGGGGGFVQNFTEEGGDEETVLEPWSSVSRKGHTCAKGDEFQAYTRVYPKVSELSR
jgi:hypothetical protein